MKLGRRRRRILIGLIAVIAASDFVSTQAHWMMSGEREPIERLIENVERFVKEHPDDAQGFFVLGRLHSKAFAASRPAFAYQSKDSPLPKFYPSDSVKLRLRPEFPLTEEKKRHLFRSIFNYRRSAELNPGDARVHLGLGWIQEQAAAFAHAFDEIQMLEGKSTNLSVTQKARFRGLVKQLCVEERETAQKELQKEVVVAFPIILELMGEGERCRPQIEDLVTLYYHERALQSYRHAYQIALLEDSQKEELIRGPGADTLISHEAGKDMLRVYEVLRFLKEREYTESEINEIAEIQQALKHLQITGFSMTPIIFSSRTNPTLADLVDPERRVSFDLDGAGLGTRWTWVQPDTSILVWDPEQTGMIQSGRQLFGNVTWWIFWDHGYQPLAALDDDGDGWLRESELQGISVWQDKNSDGRSEPSEVKTLRAAGVERVAAKASGFKDGVLWNPNGIMLKNGRYLPTFDWNSRSFGPQD